MKGTDMAGDTTELTTVLAEVHKVKKLLEELKANQNISDHIIRQSEDRLREFEAVKNSQQDAKAFHTLKWCGSFAGIVIGLVQLKSIILLFIDNAAANYTDQQLWLDGMLSLSVFLAFVTCVFLVSICRRTRE
jgi:hypothetical protein